MASNKRSNRLKTSTIISEMYPNLYRGLQTGIRGFVYRIGMEKIAMLDLHHLDDRTRTLMLSEVDYDVQHNALHISPYLSGQGQRDYPNLLREAIESGSDATLAQSLNQQRRMERAAPRRKPTGGFTTASVPTTAAETLAESEFNRYYIRAVCRRAIEDSIPVVVVYRAKPVAVPRPQSEEVLETTLEPGRLLEDLREHPGGPTELGVPGGPNSGLSVRLP
jgi:hypothetical protein